MWRDVLIVLGVVMCLEILYRVADYIIYRFNNMAGVMDEEE